MDASQLLVIKHSIVVYALMCSAYGASCTYWQYRFYHKKTWLLLLCFLANTVFAPVSLLFLLWGPYGAIKHYEDQHRSRK